MRISRISAALIAAGLSSLVLVGCGTEKSGAGTAPASAGSSVRPVSAPTAADDSASAKRFSKLVHTVNAECRKAVPAPTDANGKPIPLPEDLPGYEERPVDGYGPDNPPPTKDGIGPDPNSSEGPPQDFVRELEPRDFGAVPLDAEDRCIADKHAERIREGFGGKGATSAEVLREALLKLDYPASRVHAMPDRGGSPRVRLDLRIDSQAALEIVGTSGALAIEPFAAVAHPNLKITDVKR
ncbi:hypothetical protein ABZY68_05135 [Streptomyces sp. NPDC006482]|uniref:hypothetical protein n=1 Tax=Streptomyces sp. NPDC006482 TaxID=3154306 RepID=UPI0033BF21D9